MVATTVAGWALQALGDGGARRVFGLPGVHNMAFWRAEAPSARVVNVRHEQTAVYAADGWARASGQLGAAVVTTGPGAANTVAAFGEAAMSGSPVVLVASEVPLALVEAGLQKTLHQSRDQAAIFAPLAKATFTPRSPSEVVSQVRAAVATALAFPRGPVYLDIPADVLRAPLGQVSSPATLPGLGGADGAAGGEGAVVGPAGAYGPGAGGSLDDVARAIASAASVVIWAGGGVVASGADAELAELACVLRAPVVTSFSARGILGPDHECDMVLPPHEPEVEEMLAGAGLLLAIGTDLDGMMTKNATLRLPPKIFDINVDRERTEAGYQGVVPVIADAKVALRYLLETAKPRSVGPADQLAELQSRVWARLAADPRTSQAVAFLRCSAAAAGGKAVIVNDMTIPGYWLGNYYRAPGPRTVQYPVGWGTLGYALPASIGAAFGSDKPVLTVCGDGGFMFAVGELATIVQEDLPITILLVDDGGYGMLRYGNAPAAGPVPGADLVRPDFLKLAEAFGIRASKVTSVGPELERAIRQGLESGQPRMVLCEVSLFPPKTTSPRWREP
ncbi:MAG TPA: thiamine pyrophosphate-binding protein [Acidimicrobiales bacterium]|nr:thiamine pyrophosphate-binding protein [Acidimicrobiales bacterium]